MSFMSKDNCVVFLIFIFAFLFIPVKHLHGFSLMPGDIGDARLNNYFLENIFQFLAGNSESLWNLAFFQPFPYVLGFSDNLFGSAPIYLLTRLFTDETDTAFQIWFYFGYVVNFYSAYYALRRLGGSASVAVVGALIFSFSLPTTAHLGYAQLHYRFGLPLAIVFLADFYNSKGWRYFLIAGAWLVWQFYAGIYMGFFTLLLMSAMSVVYICLALRGGKVSDCGGIKQLLLSWCAQSKKKKFFFFILSLIFMLSLLVVLFYPYLQVSRLYGATRDWNEIASMLPRPQSYLLADTSFLWENTGSKIFVDIPMRHEHQMFIGLVPLMLAVIGFFVGNREEDGINFSLMTGMLVVTIILTLYIGGFSLWYFLHKLPLASAIRAMTRLDQAFLFPIAYLAVIAIHKMARHRIHVKKISAALIFLFIFEAGMNSAPTSTKDSWRQRIAALNSSVPSQLPDNSILFFAQHSELFFADELDAMWVSLNRKHKTMNGYSGLFPPGYDLTYGDDCSQLFKRVIYFLKFINQQDNIALYRELISRVVPIGFNNCAPAFFNDPPGFSSSDRVYTEDQFKHISYSHGGLVKRGDRYVARLSINNSADHVFAASSSVGKPIRVSWRFIGTDGVPLSGWDNRESLPHDIPANGSFELIIPLRQDEMVGAEAIQISLVQEQVFWAHDIGVSPLTIPLN